MKIHAYEQHNSRTHPMETPLPSLRSSCHRSQRLQISNLSALIYFCFRIDRLQSSRLRRLDFQRSQTRMSFVRTISMLVLVVALLLPPGLYRNCCCTQRTVSERTEGAPLRPCCLARMKAARAAAVSGTSGVRLKNPPCKCKPPVAPVAVVADKQHWSSAGLDGPINGLFQIASSFDRLTISASVAEASARNDHLIGPPLHKTLCRWII